MAQTLSFSDLDGQLRLVVMADYRPKLSPRGHQQASSGPVSLKATHEDFRVLDRPAGSPLQQDATPSYQPGSSGRSVGIQQGLSNAGIQPNHTIVRSLGSELLKMDSPQSRPCFGPPTATARSHQARSGGTADSHASTSGSGYRAGWQAPSSGGNSDPRLAHERGFVSGSGLNSTTSSHHHPAPSTEQSSWTAAPSTRTSTTQPTGALTSSLVARMETLRAQLMRVSSTLSGVQERAATLSASLDRSRAAILNTSTPATVPYSATAVSSSPISAAVAAAAMAAATAVATGAVTANSHYEPSASAVHSASAPYSGCSPREWGFDRNPATAASFATAAYPRGYYGDEAAGGSCMDAMVSLAEAGGMGAGNENGTVVDSAAQVFMVSISPAPLLSGSPMSAAAVAAQQQQQQRRSPRHQHPCLAMPATSAAAAAAAEAPAAQCCGPYSHGCAMRGGTEGSPLRQGRHPFELGAELGGPSTSGEPMLVRLPESAQKVEAATAAATAAEAIPAVTAAAAAASANAGDMRSPAGAHAVPACSSSTLSSPFVRQLGSSVLRELQQAHPHQPHHVDNEDGESRRSGGGGQPQLTSQSAGAAPSIASSLDAERVHPWDPSLQNRSSGGGAATAGDATTRWIAALDCGALSTASSLDAARVHPWSGATAAVNCTTTAGQLLPLASLGDDSVASSLELLSAAAAPPSRRSTASAAALLARGIGVGSSDGGAGGGAASAFGTAGWEAQQMMSWRRASGLLEGCSSSSSTLLPCPEVLVMVEGGAGAGRGGEAGGVGVVIREIRTESASAAQRTEELPYSSYRPSNGNARGQGSGAGAAAVAAVGSDGSESATPTPRADLSFAFHNACFEAEAGAGGDSGSGSESSGGGLESASEGSPPDDWLRRGDLDAAGYARGRGAGGMGAAYGDDDCSGGYGDEGEEEGYGLRAFPSEREREVESEQGYLHAEAGTPGGRREQQQQERRQSRSPGGSRSPYYDGYSESEGEEGVEGLRESIRGTVASSSSALECPSLRAVAGSASAGGENYSLTSAEEADGVAPAAAAGSAAAACSFASGRSFGSLGLGIRIGGGCGGSGGGSARSSTSGYSGSPERHDATTPGGGGSGGVGGHLRLVRPSRIVVPSSPRSSHGGWSLPSPVPSPYTHGVLGCRTPSSGGGVVATFSLRQHLDMTVSSSLFPASSSDSDSDFGGMVGRYDD